MQHRAEHFALDVGDFVDLDQRRRQEGSARVRRAGSGAASPAKPRAAHRLDMRVDRVARLGRDHRADVGRELARIADCELAPSRPSASSSMRSATSSCRHNTRSAEQRWPAESKADAARRPTTCSGSAERIDDHRVLAAGLGDQRDRRAVRGQRPASSRSISRATSVEPVNTTPCTRGSATSAAPTSPVAGQQLQRVGRHAGFVQQRAPPRRRSAASPRPAWR